MNCWAAMGGATRLAAEPGLRGLVFLPEVRDDVVRARPAWLSVPRQQQLLVLYKLLDDLGMPIVELCLRFAIGKRESSTSCSTFHGPADGIQVV